MCRLLIHSICGLELEKSWLKGEILLRCERFKDVDLEFKSLTGVFFLCDNLIFLREKDRENNRYSCTLFEFNNRPFVVFYFYFYYYYLMAF